MQAARSDEIRKLSYTEQYQRIMSQPADQIVYDWVADPQALLCQILEVARVHGARDAGLFASAKLLAIVDDAAKYLSKEI